VSGKLLSTDPVEHPACMDLYNYANGGPVNFNNPDGRYALYAYRATTSTILKKRRAARV